MIKISLVTPIRENITELKRLMTSLRETTVSPSEVEFIFIVDNDDEILCPRIPELTKEYSFINARFIKVTRSKHFVRDYYNFAAMQSKGRWVLALNVDTVFMTKDWDHIIDERMSAAAERFGDDFLYGIVKDGLPRQGDAGLENCKKAVWHKKVDFSCWIMVSRQFVQFYGGMMDPLNWLWGADHWTGLTWQKVFNGERVVMIRDVFIDHISHHVKDLPQPPSFRYFCDIMRQHPILYNDKIAAREAQRIEEEIKRIHHPYRRSHV